MKERTIYLRLLNDLDKLKDDVDRISSRIHELLDAIDKERAAKITEDVERELDL